MNEKADGKRNEYWKFILIGCVLCLIGVVAPTLIATLCESGTNVPVLDSGKTIVLTEGWLDENGDPVQAPLLFELEDGRRQSFSIKIPELPPRLRNPYLLLTVKYLNVRIYVDGAPVGECLTKPEGASNSRGEVCTLLALPMDSARKELRVDVELLLGENVNYSIGNPMIGSRAAMLFKLIEENIVYAIMDMMILFFGALLLLFGLLPGPMRKEGSLLSVGSFAVAFALYSLSISVIPRLFGADTYSLYLLEFLLLAVLPIPLLLGYMPQTSLFFRKILCIPLTLLFVNLLLQLFLHFCTPLELRDTVWITHTLIACSLGVAALAPMDIWRRKRQRWQFFMFSPIIVGTLIDLLRFYCFRSDQAAVGIKIGVLLFVILQTVVLIRTYLKYYERELKNKFYERMAFTDILTDLGNRAAFEQKTAQFGLELKKHDSLWCVCADLNNLKTVNDSRGHAAGDELLRAAARMLSLAATPGGAVYRTGGDEFIVLFIDQSKKAVEGFKRRLAELLGEYNQAHETDVSVALGAEQLRMDGTDSVAELINRADQLMYEDKQAYKRR